MLQQQHKLSFNHPSIEQNTTLIYQTFKNYQTYACRFDKNSAVSGKNCTKTQFVEMLINLFSAINSPFPKTTGRNEFVNYPLLKIVCHSQTKIIHFTYITTYDNIVSKYCSCFTCYWVLIKWKPGKVSSKITCKIFIFRISQYPFSIYLFKANNRNI